MLCDKGAKSRMVWGIAEETPDERGAVFGPIDPVENTMISLSRPVVSALLVLPATMCLLVGAAQAADNASEPKVKVDDNSFKCITDMTPVRHFYVDNLLGNVEETVAVAKAGKGDYPEGSVLQLMPNEVMIKQQKGFNRETHDWEFFFIDVDKNGSKIYAGFRRGQQSPRLELLRLSRASEAGVRSCLRTGPRMRSDPGDAGHVRRAAKDRSALQGSEAGKPRRRASAQGVGRSRKVAESKLGRVLINPVL